MPDVAHYLNSLQSLSFGSGSIFGLLALVCVLLFALSLGRARTLVSLLAVYVAFVLQAVFPYFGWLQQHATAITDDLVLLRIGVLLLSYILSFILLNRSVLSGRFDMGDSSFFSVLLLGVLQFGLIASILLNLAPMYADYIPASLVPYIANQKALFYWALAPLVLLVFQKRD